MSDFSAAFARTMGHEGGYANNPRDNGGETYKGIARQRHPKWSGWAIVDGVKSNMVKQPFYGTPEYSRWVAYLNSQLAGSPLLQKSVSEFYRINFWVAGIEDQRLAEELFDKRVNCGDIALRWMQRAAKVSADGVIGPKSLSAINAAEPSALLTEFNAAARQYYESIIARDPSQEIFRHSWFARLKNYDDTPYAA